MLYFILYKKCYMWAYQSPGSFDRETQKDIDSWFWIEEGHRDLHFLPVAWTVDRVDEIVPFPRKVDYDDWLDFWD